MMIATREDEIFGEWGLVTPENSVLLCSCHTHYIQFYNKSAVTKGRLVALY